MAKKATLTQRKLLRAPGPTRLHATDRLVETQRAFMWIPTTHDT